MAKKLALLIGVSDYADLPPLPTTRSDVEAMKRVLQNPQMGGFDRVESLINPSLEEMQIETKKLFADCKKDDLLLLFFSGHGITDSNGRLYLTTYTTRKDYFDATAVPAWSVHNAMNNSPARRQVVILDCCYSGAFANGWQPKQFHEWALLASSTAARISYEQEEEESGIYTYYLVEGIETGAADRDKNGIISVDELHEYAKEKVQLTKPQMKPDIQPFKEGYKISLARASSKVEYCKQWQCVHTLKSHSDTVNSVAISPDGQMLASGSNDTTIKIWNLKTGRLLHTLSGHSGAVNAVAISPDSQTLASGSTDKTIKTWNLITGKLLRTFGGWFGGWFSGHLDAINSVAISPDSQTLISGSRDHTIKLWNLATGKQLGDLSGRSWGVYSVAIAADGKTLVSDKVNHALELYDLETEELLQTFTGHSSWVWSIAIAPDGHTLASGSEDNTIKLWDLNTGKIINTLTEHLRPVHSVTFSSDGQALVSGSYDNTIKLWNVSTGELLRTITGHINGVNSVAISPNGKTLISGSDDHTVKIWQ